MKTSSEKEIRDFDYLKDDYEVYGPDLSSYVTDHFDILVDKFMSEGYLAPDINILGYSFGARLGARLFHEFPLKKLISLAGHLGISHREERSQRLILENKFQSKILASTEEEFLEYWNKLTLFQNDKQLKEINYSNAVYYFQNYGLSMQPYLAEKLLTKRDRIFFAYGEKDHKYCLYAENNLEKYNVRYLSGCGHRIIANQCEVKSLLSEVLCN